VVALPFPVVRYILKALSIPLFFQQPKKSGTVFQSSLLLRILLGVEGLALVWGRCWNALSLAQALPVLFPDGVRLLWEKPSLSGYVFLLVTVVAGMR